MNGCKDCVIYLAQNNLDSPTICEECGKQAVTWKLDKIGAPYVECSECGYKIAVDMNMPCELDSDFNENVTITIEPPKESLSKDVLMRLAKAFGMNAVQIRAKLMEGYSVGMSPNKAEEILFLLQSSDIAYTLENYVDLKERYPFYKECQYPYSRMRHFIKNTSEE